LRSITEAGGARGEPSIEVRFGFAEGFLGRFSEVADMLPRRRVGKERSTEAVLHRWASLWGYGENSLETLQVGMSPVTSPGRPQPVLSSRLAKTEDTRRRFRRAEVERVARRSRLLAVFLVADGILASFRVRNHCGSKGGRA